MNNEIGKALAEKKVLEDKIVQLINNFLKDNNLVGTRISVYGIQREISDSTTRGQVYLLTDIEITIEL